MGDGKVEKAEMHDLARKFGAMLGDMESRVFSLGLAFDCLVTVLGKTDEVKAEIDRRHKEAAERKAKQENKPLVSVP